MMKFLGKRFSKVVERIDSIAGMDRFEEEAVNYNEDYDIMDIPSDNYLKFWEGVKQLKEGSAGWERFKVLPRFALALGTLFNSNSATERMFSIQSSIGNDKSKNRRKQENLDAMLQIREGIECKDARLQCSLCSGDQAENGLKDRHCRICH